MVALGQDRGVDLGGVGGGAPAALQTEQHAQREAEHQGHHQVALPVGHLQERENRESHTSLLTYPTNSPSAQSGRGAWVG